MTTTQTTQDLHPLCIVTANEICSKQGVTFNEGLFDSIDGYLLNIQDPDMPFPEIASDLVQRTGFSVLDVIVHLHMHLVYCEFIEYANQFFDLELMDYEQAYTLLGLFKNIRPTLFELEYE